MNDEHKRLYNLYRDATELSMSKPIAPDTWPEMGVIECLPCKCGKTLEQALAYDHTTLIRLSFADKEFSQQVVCWECASV